jgi:perosamine synthetase
MTMKTNINTNMIPYSRQWLDDEEIEAVVKTLRGDYLTQGPKSEEFEEAICGVCGARYATAVSSGTAALHIAAMAAGLGPADEGITSPNTFLASANCLVYSSATPRFADIQADTYCLDPQDLKERLSPRTRAIIPVHFAGQPCDMESIWDMANARDLIVIEDAAHALGSRWQDKRGGWHRVGSCSHSHMTILSFHPVKTITTAEGGIILTNDPKIAHTCRLLRNHGITRDSSEFLNMDFAPLHHQNQCAPFAAQNQRSTITNLTHQNQYPTLNVQSSLSPPWYYEMQELGFNYRISDVQCSLGLVQIKRLPFFIRQRRRIWDYYQDRLSDIEGLTLPKEQSSAFSCWHLYAAQAEERDKLLVYLHSRGIGAHAMYIPVHLQPYYQKRFGYRKGDFPRAENYFDKSLILPLYPALTDEMLDYVIDAVKSFYKSI